MRLSGFVCLVSLMVMEFGFGTGCLRVPNEDFEMGFVRV